MLTRRRLSVPTTAVLAGMLVAALAPGGVAAAGPIAGNDAFTVGVSALQATLDVLANDTDPDGDSLSVIDVSEPAHGSAAPSIDGTAVVYEPDADFHGVDTFDYRAVEALLDRLRADNTVVYDVNEIGPLNQRLAVLRSLDICRQNAIPVIDVLPDVDALAEGDRKSLFLDMVHLTWKGDQFLGQIQGHGQRRIVVSTEVHSDEVVALVGVHQFGPDHVLDPEAVQVHQVPADGQPAATGVPDDQH